MANIKSHMTKHKLYLRPIICFCHRELADTHLVCGNACKSVPIDTGSSYRHYIYTHF